MKINLKKVENFIKKNGGELKWSQITRGTKISGNTYIFISSCGEKAHVSCDGIFQKSFSQFKLNFRKNKNA